MLEILWSTHPVPVVIGAWLALELTGYVVVSICIAWNPLKHAFAWPRRAIRMGRFSV